MSGILITGRVSRVLMDQKRALYRGRKRKHAHRPRGSGVEQHLLPCNCKGLCVMRAQGVFGGLMNKP